ncbi:DUF1669 domain-containing protein [Candidatus Cytomitobacter indipagum]|uniref:Phospholipase D n=1 Tax=Candidatus Cytomitobacter indipagum TaxID=2601575 RepID=A0A5C0UE78_9PROT|nr:phospholipase D-like domain-containing protein [Candidatus Cytomitobacter indipagum]QEK38010.1 DUF1669 domain-containing protein [Candidatus Cytomitobacter indipagum]
MFSENKLKKLAVILSSTLLLFVFIIKKNDKVKFDHIEACFIPSQKNCTKMIIREIGKAKNNVNVQAYTWTSIDISEALIEAKRKGVEVKIILDKINTCKNASIDLLQKNNITPLIDRVPGIAHNKIIIIDDEITITGSFNFSKSGQQRNLENVIKIHSKELNKIYRSNWRYREKLSYDINSNSSAIKYKPWK